MRRRLLVARGLIHRPRLVLLDEPTVGLDPQVRQELWSLIDALRAEGVTVLMSTHYIEEAERLADTVAVMSAGRIIAQGTPSELVGMHAGREVIEVYGPPARARRARVRRRAPGLASPAQRTGGRAAPRRGARRRAPEGVRRPANLEDAFVALTGQDDRVSARAPAGTPDPRVAGTPDPRVTNPPPLKRLEPAALAGVMSRDVVLVQALLEGDHVLIDRAAGDLPAGVRARVRVADQSGRRAQVRAVRRDRRGRDRSAVLVGVPRDVQHVHPLAVSAHLRRAAGGARSTSRS